MLSPDTLGTDLVSRGQEVIIHLSCKDWNRNALESRGWKLGSEGFDNVLALSGDYPVTGHKGLAAPVFDLDSVGLLSLFSEMNEGLRDERKPDTRLDRTNFFLGCVVTNHKRREREVMPQYFKLRKKVHAGARFVINQIGWNTRKDDELLRWIAREGLPVSPLANVYLLSPTAARAFNKGKIPGVVVTDELLALAERHGASPDKGRALLRRAGREARRRRARSRLLGRLSRRPHAGVHVRRDPRPCRLVRRRRLARVRAGDPVSVRGRVLLLRARPGDEALVGHGQRRLPRLEGEARDGAARAGEVQVQPASPRRRLRAGRAALLRRARVLHDGREVRGGAEDRARRRAGGEGAAVRLPRLRRLLAPRRRVRVPRVAVREEPAQRAVRRHARGALRGLRHRVHLVAGVRAAEGVRRGGVDARRPGRRQGQRARADERVGEHVPRPRPQHRAEPPS